MAGVDLCQLLLPQTGVSASVCECVVGLYGTDSCMLLIRAVLFLIEILSAHSHCCMGLCSTVFASILVYPVTSIVLGSRPHFLLFKNQLFWRSSVIFPQYFLHLPSFSRHFPHFFIFSCLPLALWMASPLLSFQCLHLYSYTPPSQPHHSPTNLPHISLF